MRNITTAATIVLLFVLGFLSCKKSPKVIYMSFAGKTKSWYERIYRDPVTNLVIDKVQWDSTYNEVVDVMIDKNQKVIRFTFRKMDSVGARPPGLIHEYPFVEGRNTYATSYASYVGLSFGLYGNTLKTNYGSFTGYTPSVSVKFEGQLIK